MCSRHNIAELLFKLALSTNPLYVGVSLMSKSVVFVERQMRNLIALLHWKQVTFDDVHFVLDQHA